MLDHITKIKSQNDAEQQKSQRRSQGNIWHNWHDGDQTVRFVGDFIVNRIFWLTPSPYNPVKLFDDSAFEGENALPKIINCVNWDIANEKEVDNGCVISKLNKIARDVLKSSSSLDEDDTKDFKDLRDKTNFSTNYRWNILDRDNPLDPEGSPAEYKICSLSYSLFNEVAAIHEEYAPADFTSVENGLDIKINKSGGGKAGVVKYRAQAVISGASLKVTPLTEEEQKFDLLKLEDICGKQVDQDLVRSKLLPKWKDLLDAYENEGQNATTSTDETSTGKSPF